MLKNSIENNISINILGNSLKIAKIKDYFTKGSVLYIITKDNVEHSYNFKNVKSVENIVSTIKHFLNRPKNRINK